MDIKSNPAIKGLVDEAVKQAESTVIKYQNRVNVTGKVEDKAKLSVAEKNLKIAKFLNAFKNNDTATLQKFHEERMTSHKSMNEGTGSAGGYLVPTEFEAQVYASFNDYSEIRRYARVVSMRSNKMNLNELLAKVTVAKVGELAGATASQPTWGEPVLTTEKYIGSTTLSQELIDDSEIDVINNIVQQYAEQFAKAEQTSFINSVVSNSEGLLQVSGTSDINLITGTTFSNLSYDDLGAMQAKLFTDYSQSEAKTGVFLMSMTAYQILRTSKASTSGNYFLPAVPTMEAPATAWGRPIIVLNEMPSTTATATKFVLYTDLSKHFVIGDRIGMRMKVNTSGTSASGENLNIDDAQELVLTKRTAQVCVQPSGIVTLATN